MQRINGLLAEHIALQNLEVFSYIELMNLGALGLVGGLSWLNHSCHLQNEAASISYAQ